MTLQASILRAGGAAVFSILAPAIAGAQGPSIEHEPVRCVVAGRPTALRACFVPVAELAAARLHFRVETAESWSQVEMRAAAGCHEGVLPALGRDVVGRKVLYAIEAVDRASAAHRTTEFAPVVVARAADCEDRGAVAPVSGRGVSTGVLIGGVAAAGAAGAVLASGGDPAAPATTMGTAPATTAPAAPPPRQSPDPPPSTTPGPGLALSCQADPRSGPAPLGVRFAAFPTGGTGSYAFEWSFGDGGTSNNPSPSHTYAAGGRFDAIVRVTSGTETATCARDITVTTPGAPGPNPTPTPAPTPNPTPTPSPVPAPQRRLVVSVFSFSIASVHVAPPGAVCSDNGGPPVNCTFFYSDGTVVTLTGSPTGPASFWSGDCSGQAPTCIVVMNADKQVGWSVLGARPAREAASPPTVSSQLDVEGGEGHVSLNGAPTSISGGRQELRVDGRTGASLVEAVLARAAGRPGTWRFELAGIQPGSLRVVAGTVALITGDAVVFRMEGKPGERVVFTFELED